MPYGEALELFSEFFGKCNIKTELCDTAKSVSSTTFSAQLCFFLKKASLSASSVQADTVYIIKEQESVRCVFFRLPDPNESIYLIYPELSAENERNFGTETSYYLIAAVYTLAERLFKKSYNVKHIDIGLHYSPIIEKATKKIADDLSGELSLKSMARLGNVSPSYFSSLFKKETGLTLTDYVNGKRIEHARLLLATTQLQVQTIAQQCGIFDLHYFCRLFKKETGLTPTRYRADKQRKGEDI